jgi:hypothetical protein
MKDIIRSISFALLLILSTLERGKGGFTYSHTLVRIDLMHVLHECPPLRIVNTLTPSLLFLLFLLML